MENGKHYFYNSKISFIQDVAQPGSASVLGTEGRVFKSRHLENRSRVQEKRDLNP